MKRLEDIIESLKSVSRFNERFYSLKSLREVLDSLGNEWLEVSDLLLTPYYLSNGKVLEIYEYELSIVASDEYDFERYLLNLTGRQNIKDVPDVIRKNQEMCHIVYKRDAKKLKASRIVEYIDYFLSRSDLKREIEECFASFDLEKLVFQVY